MRMPDLHHKAWQSPLARPPQVRTDGPVAGREAAVGDVPNLGI